MNSKWKIDYYSSPHIDDNESISLVMPDVSGGVISFEKIDEIKSNPNAKKVIISGLRQNTFDYFVKNYGNQFDVIYFWKCPLVEDLSNLANLKKVKYILWFWNQRATKLWNMENNKRLIGLCLDDFTRMHNLDDVPTAPALEEFTIGNKVWDKLVLNSIEPLGRCEKLKYLSFSAKKIIDEDITAIAKMTALKELVFYDKLFTTEQIAWLTAKMPNVKSVVLAPYWQHAPIEWKTSKGTFMKDTRVCGKGKPLLDFTLEKKRLDKYVLEFFNLVEKYRNE